MVSSNDASGQAIKEQEQMKRDGVEAYIESVSQEFRRNDSWDTFKPDEIAETSFQVAAGRTDFSTGDEQTHRFQQFLSIATNFSSLSFAQKLHKIPELVESINQLLENMMKEVQEYSDMASELHDLIQCFVRMVMQAKHNVNMMLPLLTACAYLKKKFAKSNRSSTHSFFDRTELVILFIRSSSFWLSAVADLAKLSKPCIPVDIRFKAS
ncbi:unnamed protein product [Rotaria sp. Silwood2]|nr:unnamed protein product [Rotaria sp. Silwood2]